MTIALTVAVGLLALFGSAALLLYCNDRVAAAVWRRRNPPEKVAADLRAYLLRVQSPDWTFYKEYLERPVPPGLVAWFADAKAVANNYHFDDFYVSFAQGSFE